MAAGVLRFFFMGPNAMGPVIRASLKRSNNPEQVIACDGSDDLAAFDHG